MDVGLDHAGALKRIALGAVDDRLLAGLGDEVADVVLERFGEVLLARDDEFRRLLDEGLEALGLGDEICFAVDLDERPGAALLAAGCGDEALVGLLVGALELDGLPLGAEDLDRLLDVAVRLGEGLLAVHHAGVRAVAEFLDDCYGDCSHGCYPVERLKS